MIQRHTVTANAVTTPGDQWGDADPTSSGGTYPGILFAPEGLVETTESAAPAVIGDATLYGILPKLTADDTITHAAPCCDGEDFAHATWQVVGGSRGWGRGRKAVAIQRASTE